MRFEPKSDEELSPVLKPGIYDAEVLKAEEATSKRSGAPMLKLTLRVYDRDRTVAVTDYLLESMPRKLRNFCAAAGLDGLYEQGELEPLDCVGKSVQVRLKVEHDESGQFDDKNSVADYVVEKKADKKPVPPRTINRKAPLADPNADPNLALQEAGDDDIPF